MLNQDYSSRQTTRGSQLLKTMKVINDLARNPDIDYVVNNIKKRVFNRPPWPSRQPPASRPPPPSAPRPRGPPPQRSKSSSAIMAMPSAFGMTSNNLVRSTVLKSTGDSVVMRGQTLLGPIRVASGSSTVLPVCAMWAASNPVTFDDRMKVIAQTYDKYVYNWVKLTYVPAAPTIAQGTIMLAIDRDYQDGPQLSSMASAQSYAAACMGSVYASHSCSMRRDIHEKRIYNISFDNDVSPRDSEQFKFYAFASGVNAEEQLGQLQLEYEIQLISPIYDSPAIGSINLGMQFSRDINVTYPTVNSTSANVPWLPANSSGDVRTIYECIFQGGSAQLANVPPRFKFAQAAGIGWGPASTGSLRLYAVPTNTDITTTQYTFYVDYNSAVRGIGGLFSTTAADMFTTNTDVCYRRLTYTTGATG